MTLRLNETAPDFRAKTTKGIINFHDWIGDGWAVLFSHPKDFTPVCTTELGYMAKLEPEFKKRNCKIIGLSVDPVERHIEWEKDIEETQGHAVNYPMIGDSDLAIAKLYDMLPAGEAGTSEGRTAATNQTVRSVFVVGPDKKIKLMLTYPMTTGRNFDEILRVLDSMRLTAEYKVATPVNWKNGEDVIIVPAVSDIEALEKFPQGWKTVKSYLRVVSQPGRETISAAALNQRLSQSPEKVFLIDLMNKEEFAGTHIPGAVNIPIEELANHLLEIPKDKTVVLACRKGLMKSDSGLELLRKSGFTNSMKLEGGTSGWFGVNHATGVC